MGLCRFPLGLWREVPLLLFCTHSTNQVKNVFGGFYCKHYECSELFHRARVEGPRTKIVRVDSLEICS